MKAREWLERGLQRKDPIDLLTDTWRGFNNLFYKYKGRTEREKIRNYLENNLTEESAKDLVDGHPKEVAYLVSQPVIDMRGNGKDTQASIVEYQNAGSNTEKLQALFVIIYQVRCNLEHGQKSPTRDRDVELCSSAWPFVAEIVDRNA
jgi:hypothetical protein